MSPCYPSPCLPPRPHKSPLQDVLGAHLSTPAPGLHGAAGSHLGPRLLLPLSLLLQDQFQFCMEQLPLSLQGQGWRLEARRGLEEKAVLKGRGQGGYEKGRRAPPPNPSCPLTTAWEQAPPPNRSPAWGGAQSSAGLAPFLWALAACQGETRS